MKSNRSKEIFDGFVTVVKVAFLVALILTSLTCIAIALTIEIM